MARILVVDDSMVIRKFLTRVLSQNGHEVVGQGKDGNEGVDLYKQFRPDVVILDITMPNKNGADCLKEILAFDSGARVLMFTSVSDSSIAKECMTLGSKGFLQKNIDLMGTDSTNDIHRAIEETLIEAA